MSKSVNTISFILDLKTSCEKGVKFLNILSNKYPTHTVKMLSNVEDKYDYFFSDEISSDEGEKMFKGLTYTSAFIRDHVNSCSFNPFDQLIEIKGDASFKELCKEAWSEIRV